MPCCVSFCSLLGVGRLGARGDAEVEHFDEVGLARPVGEDDVVRLQIAVDDALLVRLLERAADLPQDLERRAPEVIGPLVSMTLLRGSPATNSIAM